MVADVDHPVAARIARKLVPMLLRCQEPNGGWKDAWSKDQTLGALGALLTHGLFDELRELEPLPPDWSIARALPAPCEKPRSIARTDAALWVLDGESWSAIAVSPADGSVEETIQLPKQPGMNGLGFAPWDGVFYLTAHGQENQTHIYEVSQETGQIERELVLRGSKDGTAIVRVGRRLVICDGWEGLTWVVDLDRPEAEPERMALAAGMPDYMAADGDDIWCVDFMAPSLVRTNTQGELLDWGERPFGFNPIAWHGGELWALDPDGERICLSEKAET